MSSKSPSTVIDDKTALNDLRRLFFIHVGAVVLTAAVVVPLLLGIAVIPPSVSVLCCVLIATLAITFVAASARSVRHNRVMRISDRIQCLVLTLGLSIVQAIFVLPVLICIFTPTFRA